MQDLPDESESTLTLRMNEVLIVAAVAQRPPRSTDARAERCLRDETTLPNGFDQLILAHDSVAMLDEVNDQIEDLRLDVNNHAGSPQFLPGDIDFETCEAEVRNDPRGLGGLFAHASAVWMGCLHVSRRRYGVAHGKRSAVRNELVPLKPKLARTHFGLVQSSGVEWRHVVHEWNENVRRVVFPLDVVAKPFGIVRIAQGPALGARGDSADQMTRRIAQVKKSSDFSLFAH